MDTWHAWSTALLGFILTILGINYQFDKINNREIAKDTADKLNSLANRTIVLESSATVEREVHKTLEVCIKDIQTDTTDIKIQLAQLVTKLGEKNA